MPFQPTYVVTISAEEIACGEAVNGQQFASAKNATISRKNRPDCQRTVMAFGPAASILGSLKAGEPVRLLVQHNGGTLRVIARASDDGAAA